jgi:hypothetical protein
MFLRAKVLRLVNDDAHHPIIWHNEVGAISINNALLRLAILTNIGESEPSSQWSVDP